MGHSTFVKEIADEEIRGGAQCKKTDVEMQGINDIIADNFDHTPDLLAIDAEGMDFIIISDWNSIKHPIRIVITELMENSGQ